jgi:hypothetical protein
MPSPAGAFSKLLGTIVSYFQVGGAAGPTLNSNSGALETKNAANNAFAVHRGASPVGDNDFTTKAYVDKVANKPTVASLQFNGGNALPSNSGTEQWYVVTTTGANATIGQLLWDDGSGSGTVAVIPAVTGNTIVTTAAFTGGTISLAANQMYIWTGTAWLSIAPSVSGATYMIRLPITTAASQSSATQIPANAYVYSAELDITTPYSAGATITLGVTGTAAAFMATTDSTVTLAGIYEVPQDTLVSSAAALLVTVAGAPSAGAGTAIVLYSVPNQ